MTELRKKIYAGCINRVYPQGLSKPVLLLRIRKNTGDIRMNTGVLSHSRVQKTEKAAIERCVL